MNEEQQRWEKIRRLEGDLRLTVGKKGFHASYLARWLGDNGYGVEDLAQIPDAVLLDLRDFGPKYLAAVRAVIPYQQPVNDPTDEVAGHELLDGLYAIAAGLEAIAAALANSNHH